MTDPASSAPRSRPRRWQLYLGIAIVLVFIAAMVTQYVRTQRVRDELARTRLALAVATSEATLYAAAVDAQQGRYEPARQLASRFFTHLQQRVLNASVADRAALQAILDQRDAIITLLSRADPAAVNALARLATRYRTLLHGEEPARESAPPSTSPPGR
ncbi:MAG TPA: hypothetical protein VFS08_10655 [Gemmatimonadaceae bacterium]|nr:hypothetical protein [Gemmatimonadaceae bacterium]